MSRASRHLITLLGVVIVVALYILLGRYPNGFTTYVSGALLVCGLILLFVVNAYIGHRYERGAADAQKVDEQPGKEDES